MIIDYQIANPAGPPTLMPLRFFTHLTVHPSTRRLTFLPQIPNLRPHKPENFLQFPTFISNFLTVFQTVLAVKS